MTRLSVNLNKVALLRNSRKNGIPSVIDAAQLAIEAGAQGITVHPRPDQRHIRSGDVYDLADFLKDYPDIEFNLEGNPFPMFIKLVREVKPAQCTLVPDAPEAVTSDHGWNLDEEGQRLKPLIAKIHDCGTRVSLFMDADRVQWQTAADLGADRVELYTQTYAEAFARADRDEVFEKYAAAAAAAQSVRLGVNAGHDLNLQNLGMFCRIPGILEVSIGHALIADALEIGLANAVTAYLNVLNTSSSKAC